ncbi:tetratricopeptide repeat protein [Sphingobacterium sp. UT-1RO-CII-1]|uniref:tetratricopeptide repeat protein n=1 Tax=Sphingobacterium sp. UT-1RO-CII-1 TaxID=2995225 RepID=UPI00227C0C7F|nr:tetratricopeptide repeat protein [Sphingobacterium sp. UT-1RO-CII-1]MCY4778215.1 tetratricopeptide repeat protein [Sphingobacterium sp. UT-1RO-CII-1]
MNTKVKTSIFKTLALSLPFLLLALAELGLRYADYGDNLDDLFLTTPDNNYHYLNKNISKRYFNGEQASHGNAEFFKTQKDSNTFRLFVLGESAALGFPYPNNIAFSRMLKYILQENYPHKDIEVINLSFSAINSHTFLDFSKQLPDYTPDGVLIYGGHNEYYGALGVASSSSWGHSKHFVRIMIELKSTRLYQILATAFLNLRRKSDKKNNTLMQNMVNDQSIDYEGTVYQRGVIQFKQNMQDLLALFEKKSIPVFLSTVAVNLKDLAPFKSCGESESNSANLYFKKGEAYYKKANYKQAEEAFAKALDYDCIRFRAPKEINQLVRTFAKQYKNVHLVEGEAAFKAGSAHGIVGNELLLEHVHPNILGHKTLAQTFYQSLAINNLLPKGAQVINPSLEDYPILAFDSLAAHYALNKLLQTFPFYQEVENARVNNKMEQIAWDYNVNKNWYKSMDQLYSYALEKKEYPLILQTLKVRIVDNTYDAKFQLLAGEALAAMADYESALAYFEKSFKLKPSFELGQSLVVSALRIDQPKKALEYIPYMIEHNTGQTDFVELKTYIAKVIHLKELMKNLNEGQEKTTIQLAIAENYDMIGNKAVADLYRKQ